MIRGASRRVARLWSDRRGAYMIELALLMPILLMLIVGIFDYALQAYIRGTLYGAVQSAGRANSLESGDDIATVDNRVVQELGGFAKFVTLSFSRANYESFGDVSKPEAFTDANGNNRYDSGECFTDVNNNSTWDASPGSSGRGGANDVVLYQVTAEYRRLFPIWRFIGQSSTTRMQAQTILRNQPYGEQAQRSAGVVRCG